MEESGLNHKRALVLLMVMLIAACSLNANQDLYDRVAEIKARPAGKIPPLPVFKEYRTVPYSAMQLADPFKNFMAEVPAEVSVDVQPIDSPLKGRNLEALEEYPLDTLRFVGQLTKDGSDWAIITSPDMIVHRVRVGNHMGKNYGEIISIGEDKVLIEEIIPDELGGWVKRDAALSLAE
ncbi:MAG: pilus assembly protein PilP [Chromatiales bacterium]|nr:pilus assembly protein PilP [Chromatiales bacterium]